MPSGTGLSKHSRAPVARCVGLGPFLRGLARRNQDRATLVNLGGSKVEAMLAANANWWCCSQPFQDGGFINLVSSEPWYARISSWTHSKICAEKLLDTKGFHR